MTSTSAHAEHAEHTAHTEQDHPGARSWAERVEQMSTDDLRLLAMSMPAIEQAKGILMGHFGCEPTTAFTILQRWSSVKKAKLRDLAASLVDEASHDGASSDDGPRSGAVERFLRRQGLG